MKIRKGFVSNSSSSCFICNTDKDDITIKTELSQLLNLLDTMCNRSTNWEDTFEDPWVCDKDTVFERDLKNNYEYKGTTTGKVILQSASDNSIPYSLTYIIMEAYDAERIHLG